MCQAVLSSMMLTRSFLIGLTRARRVYLNCSQLPQDALCLPGRVVASAAARRHSFVHHRNFRRAMARVNQRPSETPALSSHLSVVPSSVAPSSPNLSSDKENQSDLAPRDKGKGRMQSTRSDSHSAKRRRTQARPTATAAHDQELDESRFYDPTQDQHERQEIKKKSRALEREFNGACPCIPLLAGHTV